MRKKNEETLSVRVKMVKKNNSPKEIIEKQFKNREGFCAVVENEGKKVFVTASNGIARLRGIKTARREVTEIRVLEKELSIIKGILRTTVNKTYKSELITQINELGGYIHWRRNR